MASNESENKEFIKNFSIANVPQPSCRMLTAARKNKILERDAWICAYCYKDAEVTKTENWVISFIGVIVLQLIFWWGGWYSNF